MESHGKEPKLVIQERCGERQQKQVIIYTEIFFWCIKIFVYKVEVFSVGVIGVKKKKNSSHEAEGVRM